MLLPTDTTPSPVSQAASLSGSPDDNYLDTAPLVTPEQREADFNKLFAWHGVEIAITIASELYYRELRAHMNAPALGDYVTQYDRDAEAPRILYCAHLKAADIRRLRLLSPFEQIELYDTWVEKNIPLHELRAAGKLADDMLDVIHRARTQPAESGDDPIDGAGN